MQASPAVQSPEFSAEAEDIPLTPDPAPAAAPASPAPAQPPAGYETESGQATSGAGFEAVMRIPVNVQVVLGTATMPVAKLMKLGRGAIIPLDHRVGEPVEVVVNGRMIARGEIVVLEEDNSRLGISLTEISGPPASPLAK